MQKTVDVVELELLHSLWDTMVARFKADRKNSYKNMTREAISAIDRIRRSKQNVPFPVYDSRYLNRPELLYKLYMDAYPKMLAAYNKAILDIRMKENDEELGNIQLVSDGRHSDGQIAKYFSMLLLILFGRVMKKLGDRARSKYDAIMLDCYFACFCKMGTDIYMMSDVWNMCKDFVVYCIDHYPESKK